MRMRWKLIFCAALLLLAVWSLTSVLGQIGVLPASARPEAEDTYLLREYEGYVAVWYPAGAEHPAMITETRTDSLPPSDRAALRAGIPAADREEMARLLDDLTG